MTTLIFALFVLGTIGFVIGAIFVLDRHARRMHGGMRHARSSSDSGGGMFMYGGDGGSTDCSSGSDGGGCDGGGGGD